MSCPDDRRNGGTVRKTGHHERRQDGDGRRHAGADRGHAAGQGVRPRRHGGGQPPLHGGGAVAVPHGVAVARPPRAVREPGRRLQAVPAPAASAGLRAVPTPCPRSPALSSCPAAARRSGRPGRRPAQEGDRTFQGRPDGQGRGRRGRAGMPCPLHGPARPGARPYGVPGLPRRPGVRGLRRRQGVRRGPAARGPCGTRGGGGGPVEAEPDGAAGARPGRLRVAAPGGEPLREGRGVPGGRGVARQDRRELRGGDRLVAGVVAAT